MKLLYHIFSSIIALGIIFFLITGGHQASTTLTKANESTIPQNKKELVATHYFVPVTSFADYRTNISSTDLGKQNLCASIDDKRYLEKILPDMTISYFNTTKIKPTFDNKIWLLSPDDIDFSMKTLKIDNQNFWDKGTDLSLYPLKSTELSDTNTEAKDLRERFFVGGEIIPARAVDRLALNKYNNYTYLFDFFRHDIETADLSLAMLENPISGDPEPCTGCMSFVGDEKNAAGLSTVGFDMLSLAGNHAGDGNQSAYARTIEVLKAAGIETTGTGKSDEDKIRPAIKVVNGQRIGLIGADSISSYYWNKGTNRYGTNWFSNQMNNGTDQDRVDLIKTLKAQYQIDYLIIYMSWGIEYTNVATKFQTDLAHDLIDHGADLIVSSHPHWVQNMEIYKGVPIFYALGNFIFDQTHTDPTREGVVLNLYYYNHTLKSIEIVPHLTCSVHMTSNNLTEKYLNGQIDKNFLSSHPENQGCVYLQPRALTKSDSRYKEILDRMMQYTKF
ncbi:MAG: CapA family protein [Candidatus Berkelbacteria bacterium]